MHSFSLQYLHSPTAADEGKSFIWIHGPNPQMPSQHLVLLKHQTGAVQHHLSASTRKQRELLLQHDGKVPSVKPRCLSWGRDGAADADMKWEELWNRWTHPCLSLTAYIGWSPTERIFRKLRNSLYVRMQSIKKVGQCQSSVSELSVKAVKKKKNRASLWSRLKNVNKIHKLFVGQWFYLEPEWSWTASNSFVLTGKP